MENKRLWYIVQTYSGFENSVKENLKRRIETMQMENKIFEVMIPEELKAEKKADGSVKEKMVKMFPGYVFIEMIVTDDSWFVVRNTPGVTGFVGLGDKPVARLQKRLDDRLVRVVLVAHRLELFVETGLADVVFGSAILEEAAARGLGTVAGMTVGSGASMGAAAMVSR